MSRHPASVSDNHGHAPIRAAVIGAGAMGTLIAAVLGQFTPVVLVCRNKMRAAQLFDAGARSTGMINATSRPIIVRDLDEVRAAGGANLIVVATKTTAITSVATDLKARLSSLCDDPKGPIVVSFQNGVDPGRELMERLGHPRVIRMVLSLGATVTPEGDSVRVTMNQPPHAIGSIDPMRTDDCHRIAELLSAGGLQTEPTDDIESAVWQKAIVNAAVNPVAALVNCPVGEVLESPSSVIVDQLVAEGIAVARAEQIKLPTDYVHRVGQLLKKACGHIPSMVQDIRHGRESEIGQLNRQIIDHGRRLGVPTPTHETIDALIETFDWKVYRA